MLYALRFLAHAEAWLQLLQMHTAGLHSAQECYDHGGKAQDLLTAEWGADAATCNSEPAAVQLTSSQQPMHLSSHKVHSARHILPHDDALQRAAQHVLDEGCGLSPDGLDAFDHEGAVASSSLLLSLKCTAGIPEV